ncbi:MAG: selenium-dependent molybdenum cofactor biosynthesis protein YqeB [Anaerolineales bacterium]
MNVRILVRGSNDIASAVAHALFKAGFHVALHEIPKPTVTRRKMAFTDAIFDGHTALEGVYAFRVNKNFLLRGMLIHHQVIPVSVDDFGKILDIIRPQVLVDARMRKHQQPEVQLGLAPLTIGLGPNFVAGVTTDWVVETIWGGLGQVLRYGSSIPLRGEPKELGGHGRDRYVYAPCAGKFHTTFEPGDAVEQGQVIAHLNTIPLHAPLTGLLRGITHSNVPVAAKTKVIEVDPRGQDAQISGIGERPAKIAKGVLQAVQDWKTNHAD